ncbi:MAG: hypothetical protein ACR2H3_03660 [Acidimicrobiales bacterium]
MTGIGVIHRAGGRGHGPNGVDDNGRVAMDKVVVAVDDVETNMAPAGVAHGLVEGPLDEGS